MIRETTIVKEKEVLKRFRQLLRSGKDYSTNYMYSEAGKKCFLSAKTAGDIIRKEYKKGITEEMERYVAELSGETHNKKVAAFGILFGLCNRESRYMINFIKTKK